MTIEEYEDFWDELLNYDDFDDGFNIEDHDLGVFDD